MNTLMIVSPKQGAFYSEAESVALYARLQAAARLPIRLLLGCRKLIQQVGAQIVFRVRSPI